MINLDAYCMKCKKKVSISRVEKKVYTTSRGVKYGIVGVCPTGHKVSSMIKKDSWTIMKEVN